ncbi:ABC transporter, permease protein [Aromatoleum bremense]|uniref:branched-chain amino acid ABC transporter permease n=1 Tax=Aromatoleum bremense TaxID=76115 RepID=UPI001BB540CB|nr:branched-chain amino acid ABC transporter permease [Aromatoleum bremense]QTQ30272.1 ABC transporter, permease protein [Aromatoleum bremense]
MTDILGIPLPALMGQLTIGLVNGSFYALLSLGLAVIFGMLNVINFSHGAFYMLGAMLAWVGLTWLGIGYWLALLLSPLIVGAGAMLFERTLLRRLYKLDHLYGLLLTFGLALMIEGLSINAFGSSGQPYAAPDILQGGIDLGFMFLPIYRAWVVACSVLLCLATWLLIERTSSVSDYPPVKCRVAPGTREHEPLPPDRPPNGLPATTVGAGLAARIALGALRGRCGGRAGPVGIGARLRGPR